MKPQKKITVILKGQAREEYELLLQIVKEQRKKGKSNSEEMQLLKSIDNKIAILKLNPVYGQNIPKKLIPKALDVDNLFRIELTNFWRMLYTLRTNKVEIVSFVLHIIDHKDYDKMFGYRGK
jgi:Txe/YoeB family toxin of Txe-Axe toxin-antitoxin module